MGTAARETPASRAAVPKSSRLVASGAGPYGALSCFFRVIREIVVPTDRGATMRECKAVSGSFAVQIRPIVVPTGPGATQLYAFNRFTHVGADSPARSGGIGDPRRAADGSTPNRLRKAVTKWLSDPNPTS